MKCFGRIKHSNTTKLQNDMQKIPYSPSSRTAKKHVSGALSSTGLQPGQILLNRAFQASRSVWNSLIHLQKLQRFNCPPRLLMVSSEERRKGLISHSWIFKSNLHFIQRRCGEVEVQLSPYESHEVQLSIIAHRGWHRKLPLNLTFHVSMDFAYGFMIIVMVPSGLVPSPASACQGQLYSQKFHSETHPLSAYVRLSLLPSTATANCRFLTLKS